ANLFGQDFAFNPDAEMPQGDRDKEFTALIGKIDGALQDQVRRSQESLQEAFKYVSEMARRDAYRLALLRFSNASLESLWTKAYDEATKQWKGGLTKPLQVSDSWQVDETRRFLQKHPSSPSKKDDVDKLFADIRFVSGQEHATFLKTVFDRH